MQFLKPDVETCGGGPKGSAKTGKIKETQAQSRPKRPKCKESKAQKAKMKGKQGPKGENDKIKQSRGAQKAKI